MSPCQRGIDGMLRWSINLYKGSKSSSGIAPKAALVF